MPNKKQFGAIVAWLGNFGEAIGKLKKLGLVSGVSGIAIGVVCAIYAIVWGILERKNTRTAVRALSIVSLILAPLLLIYFLLLGFVLRFQEAPPTSGLFLGKDYQTLQLKDEFKPGQKVGEQVLNFSSKADLATVIFTPSDKDRSRVNRIIVSPIGARKPGLAKLVRADPKEDGLLIEKPEPALTPTIRVRISALLENDVQASSIEVIVVYEYARRNWKWKFMRWVFDEYSWHIQLRSCVSGLLLPGHRTEMR